MFVEKPTWTAINFFFFKDHFKLCECFDIVFTKLGITKDLKMTFAVGK